MFKSHTIIKMGMFGVSVVLRDFSFGVFRALGILGPLSRPAPLADKKLPWKTHFFNGHLIEILLKKIWLISSIFP